MFIIVLGLSIGILAIGFLGMAITIVVKKNGKFPNTSVGHNPKLRKMGITCEKCDELKRCRPNIKKKKAEKDERLKRMDEALKEVMKL